MYLSGLLTVLATWVVGAAVVLTALWFVIRSAMLSAMRIYEREKRTPPM